MRPLEQAHNRWRALLSEPAFKAAHVLALRGGEDAVVVGHSMRDEVVNDARQFVRRRRGRLRGTQARPHAAKVLGQGRWAAVQRLGRPAQSLGGPIGAGTGACADDLAASDLVVGAQVQPGRELRRGRKAGQIRTKFGEQDQSRAFAYAGYQRQVGAEQLCRVTAQVEPLGR